MAASDAIPVPRKNTAFRFTFAIRKPSDSTLITTWTGMDSEVSLDGAGFNDCTNEATEIGTTGVGYIDLTASEMNADCVVLKVTVTNTGAVPLVFVFYPETAGDYRVADTQKVDVETIKTQTVGTTGAGTITFPASATLASTTNITAATGIVLSGVTHTGAVIPTVSTLTGHTPQTGDSYAIVNSGTHGNAAIKGYVDDIGVAGAGLTALGDTRIANLDATVSSRMATYTQPTGFLGATFPTTVASTTNITAGTITTATNVTTVNGIANNVITAASIAASALNGKGDWLLSTSTGSGLTAIPWNASWDTEVESEVNDALVAIHLDHLLAADYDPASKPGVATALLNELVESDAGVSRYTANALEQAPTGGSAPTVGQIATAVWQDTTAGDFTVAGSIGKSLFTSGAAPGAAGGLFIAGSNAATTAATWNVTGAATNGSTVLGNTTAGTWTQTGAASWGATTMASLAVSGTTTLTGMVALTGGVDISRSGGGVVVQITGNDSASTIAVTSLQAACLAMTAAGAPNTAVDCAVFSVGAGSGSGLVLRGRGSANASTGGAGYGLWSTGLSGGRGALVSAVSGGLELSNLTNNGTTILTGDVTAASATNNIVLGTATVAAIQSGLALETTSQSILADTAEIGAAGAGLTALATAENLTTVAGYLDTEIAAILADTNELQTDWTNGGRLDLLLDSIIAKTNLIPSSPAAVSDIPTVSQIWTTALTEAYRATGATGSAAQLLYEILQNLTEFDIASVTKTVKKLGGASTAKTYTLNSATAPTAITEAT